MAFGIGEAPERSPGALLERVSYPATRRDLIEAAEDEHAPPEVLNFFRSLPDRTWPSADAVRRDFAEADARFGMGGHLP